MKKLRYPTNAEQAAYMRMRQQQNRSSCLRSRAESWAKNQLENRTALTWTRQSAWGNRLFDFWCRTLGCAVEVDGPEHKPWIDQFRDEYNFRRSAIVVLRVKNFSDEGMNELLRHIPHLQEWGERREQIGINRNTRKGRRQLAEMPYPPQFLPRYLREHIELAGRPFHVRHPDSLF